VCEQALAQPGQLVERVSGSSRSALHMSSKERLVLLQMMLQRLKDMDTQLPSVQRQVGLP